MFPGSPNGFRISVLQGFKALHRVFFGPCSFPLALHGLLSALHCPSMVSLLLFGAPYCCLLLIALYPLLSSLRYSFLFALHRPSLLLIALGCSSSLHVQRVRGVG